MSIITYNFNSSIKSMTNKTNFISYFLLAFTLAFISSALLPGTLDFKDKKKEQREKEELTADGPYVLYQLTAKPE